MKRLIFVILITLTLVVASAALAQAGHSASTAPSTGYDLSWNTIDGGGGTSTGGGYTLVGTSGQPDAGPLMNGGGYSLAGGFWGGAMNQYQVYLPVVIK